MPKNKFQEAIFTIIMAYTMKNTMMIVKITS